MNTRVDAIDTRIDTLDSELNDPMENVAQFFSASNNYFRSMDRQSEQAHVSSHILSGPLATLHSSNHDRFGCGADALLYGEKCTVFPFTMAPGNTLKSDMRPWRLQWPVRLSSC